MREKVIKEMDKSISVKLPNNLLEQAREKSKQTGVALSFVVRKAIEDWVSESQESKTDKPPKVKGEN